MTEKLYVDNQWYEQHIGTIETLTTCSYDVDFEGGMSVEVFKVKRFKFVDDTKGNSRVYGHLVKKAVKDYITKDNGCTHDYDCCGCLSAYVQSIHIQDHHEEDTLIVTVHVSYQRNI